MPTKPKPKREVSQELADCRRAYRLAKIENERQAQTIEDMKAAIRKSEEAVPTFQQVLTTGRRWHLAAVERLGERVIADLHARKEFPPDVNIWMHNHLDALLMDEPRTLRAVEATLLLAFSDNPTAYESEHGESAARGADLDDRARAALEADVWEYLNRQRKRWSAYHFDEDL